MIKSFQFSLVLIAGTAIASGAESDGWTTNFLTGTGRDPLPYLAEPFLPELKHDKPVDLEFVPGCSEIVVVEFERKIYAFEEGSTERRLVADFAERPHFRLYNVEFHPDFPETPRAWLALNEKIKGVGHNRIYELKATLNDDGEVQLATDLDQMTEILSWESTGHDGCDLKYLAADGCLYISTGDGQAPGDPANTGQTTDNLLGSILRIEVSDPANPVEIPSNNPFVDDPTVRNEVWAYGLRNPWRMSFLPGTTDLFVGDNGDENWDSIRRVTRGTNHGWSTYEGSVPFRLSNPLGGPVKELTSTVVDHPHTEIRSIIGGFFYRGKSLPELVGKYVYGCYLTGKVWAFDWNDETNIATNPHRICDSGGSLVSFEEDHDHELLMVNYDGAISRLIRNPSPLSKMPIPPMLSETGLFSDTKTLSPAPGVLPYEIAAPAWQDGADVIRHFGIATSKSGDTPKINKTAGEREKKSWQFPNGSAFSQTIVHNGKRTETRLMHKDGDEWQFFSFRWREDGTDAQLAPEEGGLTLDDQRIPSRAECTTCHTQRSFFVLGLSTEQLNIPVVRDGTEVNQLDWMIAQRPHWFNPGQVNENWKANRLSGLPNPHNPESGSLDARARTYLHVNCAHCHRESGIGGRAQFQLLKSLSLKETKTLNTTPLLGLPGATDPKIIAPGHPDRSELLRRIATEGGGRMPLLDSMKVDEAGVELIREWIELLKP